MTPEEAKARVAAQDAELRELEATVARIAAGSPGPAMLAIIRCLVEMVCAAQGPVFVVHNKIKFYKGVVGVLQRQGLV